MPIRIVCPGCHKTLRAEEKLAGKSVRCPGCRAAVSIPAVTERGSAPPPATPATPGRAADPPGRPSAPPAPSALDWWDDFDAGNPAGRVLVPLGLQVLGGADDVEARLQKMAENDPAFAARYTALEEQAAFSKQDFFAACPDGRIEPVCLFGLVLRFRSVRFGGPVP